MKENYTVSNIKEANELINKIIAKKIKEIIKNKQKTITFQKR